MQTCVRSILMLSLTLAACGGDDGGSGSGSGDGGACPALSGTWTIASHCSATLVGQAVPVTQQACVITTGGTFAGLTGPVKSDGSFTLTGTIAGTALTCAGNAGTNQLTETCNGCAVTLTR